MSQKILPPSLLRLVAELKKLPSIGEKSALRIILSLIRKDKTELLNLSNAFKDAYDNIGLCKNCFNLAQTELCEICKDEKRDKSIICVVEDIGDLISIEKSGQYKGLYHVLGGLISPAKGIKFENLTIFQLKNRVLNSRIAEIILALNPTLEGETTSLYIKDYLKEVGIRITRIAYGIPMGSDIEYLDEITMAVALLERKAMD